MKSNSDKITANHFANIYGLSDMDKITINKKYGEKEKTEKEWYSVMNKDFVINKPYLEVKEEVKEEEKNTIKSQKK